VTGVVVELGVVLATELLDGTELPGADVSSVAQAATVVSATASVTFHHRAGETPTSRSSVRWQNPDRAEGRSRRAAVDGLTRCSRWVHEIGSSHPDGSRLETVLAAGTGTIQGQMHRRRCLQPAGRVDDRERRQGSEEPRRSSSRPTPEQCGRPPDHPIRPAPTGRTSPPRHRRSTPTTRQQPHRQRSA